MKLYQYAIIWHPTKKQSDDEGLKPKLIKDMSSAFAKDENAVLLQVSSSIPEEYKNQTDQLEVLIRPF